MKNGFKKFVKGMFGIFIIKLTILGIVLIYQACETESEEFNFAKENFLSSVRSDIFNVQKISVSKSLNTNLNFNRTPEEIQEVTTTICIYSPDDTSRPIPSEEENVDLGQLMEIEDVDVGFTDSNGNSSEDTPPYSRILGCFEIPVEPTESSMQSSLTEAKNYLYSKGFTDNDINDLLSADAEGPAIDESALVPAVMAMIAEEQNQTTVTSSFNYSSLFISSAHANSFYQENDLYDCALRSLGISALTEAFEKGLKSEAGKKALKKAIRKVAARTLGWVGAAWAAYEFGDCMGWW